jgi:anti-sigma factor RsiW
MTRDRKEDSMSHVDEGTLHAYLDAELPSPERAALESHFAQCATCRAQLAEERALLERSTALLGSARPVERAIPPFEQVRRAPPRPWYVRTGFAWAASLVLAVGLGYYLADATGPRPEPASVGPTVATAVPESVPTNPVIIARQENAPAQKATRTRHPSAPPQPEEKAQLSQADAYRRDSDVAGYTVQPPVVSLRGAAPLPLDTVRRLHDSARTIEEAGAVGRAAAAPSANRADNRSVRNLVSTSWPVISRGKAASLLGDRPVGVPGLATRGIRSSPTGDGTVVVEQALDSKTVIQIFQRSASSAEVDELGARERADRVLARYVGRLRVEITGPVSTDSLNKLLEQVEPIP